MPDSLTMPGSIVSYVDGHLDYIKIYWNNTLLYPNQMASLAASALTTLRPGTIINGAGTNFSQFFRHGHSVFFR